ncbi:MAG: hypothetical protein HXX10_07760 [Rhodoplanes sp.]|uniref:hypothetical protein n=1 Tax=Rhodoplanes sp. TaxID=1968906 RepID=UPI0017CB51DA|nr:hypothetical protein [Rhodoplanes sp.]NVO13917.1 hypothetical protein [Rhodoplanes sp.]
MNIYSLIPASRADARWYSWLAWALFGNDEDGACGERSGVPTYGTTIPEADRVTWRQFARWQARNPAANLFVHALAWVRPEQLVLYEAPPARWWVSHPPINWAAFTPNPQIVVAVLPPFISWRVAGWEGYLGWRCGGELGACFRRA